MTFRIWRTHFEHNARRPLPSIDLDDVPHEMRAALASALGKLHLGETGEGRIAHQIESFAGVDDDYRAALRLFVAEEGRHARILGQLLRGLDTPPLERHPTAWAFRLGRNLLGVRWKLWVLDVSEIVATVVYRELAAALPEGPTRAALCEIAHDEAHHFAFHGALFSQWVREAPWLKRPLGAAWWLSGIGATSVVLASYGETLASLGVPRRRLCTRMLEQVALGARLLGGDA